MGIIEDIEKSQMNKEIAQFKVGDTVKVFSKIVEGGKERTQGFEGIVIKRQGGSNRQTFTVRRLVQGIGIERTFPLYSPLIEDVKLIRSGKVKRAKLFYLRSRIGSKATRVDEDKSQINSLEEKA
jgi:large subunit ribosomal protein L19